MNRNNKSNVIVGLVIIVVGLLIGLKMFNILTFEIFFDGWYALFFIVPAIVSIMKNKFNTGNTIILCVGAVVFLNAQSFIPRDIMWKIFVPLTIVLVGLVVIFGNKLSGEMSKRFKTVNQEGMDCYEAYFASNNTSVTDVFKGAKVSTIFGGIELRLNQAVITEDVYIDASAVFGGVEIYVPANVKVVLKSTPIFGGVSNKAPLCNNENSPTIFVNATAIFGGVEIK